MYQCSTLLVPTKHIVMYSIKLLHKMYNAIIQCTINENLQLYLICFSVIMFKKNIIFLLHLQCTVKKKTNLWIHI